MTFFISECDNRDEICASEEELTNLAAMSARSLP